MPEGLGPVVLEGEMAEPGERVADDRGGDQPAPIAGDAGQDQRRQPEQAAEIVQPAGARIAVRRQIALPELGVAHGRVLAAWVLAKQGAAS